MEQVRNFERQLADFYSAPYAVATDSCTHAIELCLRMKPPKEQVLIPARTYISVPFTFIKLGLKWKFIDQKWQDFYPLVNTNIIDAAVHFQKGGYVANSLMCLSFQYQKQLKIGKGGAILTDNTQLCDWLKLVRHDGRDEIYSPWTGQPKFSEPGYHYNLIPEDCALGIMLMDQLPKHNPDAKENAYTGYPDLSNRLTFLSKS